MTARRSPSSVFLALAVSVASLSALQSLVVPVLPEMQRDLGTTPDGIAWTLTAWLLTAAVATPVLGRVGDLVGKRRVFVGVLLAILAGDAVAALSPDLSVLLAGRVLQGVGGALFPLAFGLIRDTFPPRRMPSAIGAMSAVIAAGSGAGTVAAGPLSALLGWRGLFLMPLAIAALGLVLVLVAVPPTTVRASGRLNVPAALLLSAGLVALLMPLTSGARWGWGSPVVIALLIAAAVLLAAWVAVELRSSSPLVDMRTMRSPVVWTTNLGALMLGAAMFGVFAYFARFVQTPASTGYGLGESVSASGMLMLPLVVTMAIVGFASGPLSAVVPFRVQFVAGSLVMAGSAAALALLHTTPLVLAAETGAFGLGLGAAYASMTSIVVASVPMSQTGVASGVNANLRTIGGAIGTAVIGSLVFARTDAAGLPREAGYTHGFVLVALLALAAALVPAAAMLVEHVREHGLPERRPDAVELEEAEDRALEDALIAEAEAV